MVDLQVCAGEAQDGAEALDQGGGQGWKKKGERSCVDGGHARKDMELRCAGASGVQRRGPTEPMGWVCLCAPVRDTVGQQGGLWNSEAIWILS